MTHHRYVGLAEGQIHVHAWSGPGEGARRPLVCFHPMPNSGAFFADLAAQLAGERTVYCPDLPGFGGSYRPSQPNSIMEFAEQMTRAVRQLPGVEGGIDLLGFHTGCFVAAELAIADELQVGRLVLPGIPFFPPQTRAKLKATNARPPDYLDEPAQLGELWQSRAGHIEAGASRDRVFQVLVEDLRSAPNGWWGFAAAFDYPAEERLPAVQQPVLALADRGLFEPTCEAAELMPHATLVRRQDLGAPLFLLHAAAVATLVRDFLDAGD